MSSVNAMKKPKNSLNLKRTLLRSKLFSWLKLYRLAEELLDKESITLPDIIRVLGDRPFPLKESIREYLHELEERQQKEEEIKESEE